MKIFISYRREDSSGHVGRLHDRLIESFSPNDIFVDIDTIEPGEDFVEAVEQAVSSAEVLLAVIGKQWLTLTDARGKRRIDNPHDFVRLEIAAALRRNIRVIPILVREASMPESADLPEDLRPLTRRNAFEIGEKSFHRDVSELIGVLKRKGTSAESASARAPKPSAAAKAAGSAQKGTVPAAASLWGIVGSSALIVGVEFLLFTVLWDVFGADSVDDVSQEFLLLLAIAWLVHGLTTEHILYRARFITRGQENRVEWLIKTAVKGMAANGFLLRRSGISIGWRTIVIIAAGWIAAFFAVGSLVEYIMVTVVGNSEWSTLNSTSVSHPAIFLTGFIIGALGGLVTVLVTKWVNRGRSLRGGA
jgi:hypothetical protein